MIVAALAAKASVAAVLLISGGAKVADLAGFTAVVRLLAPSWLPAALVRAAAPAVTAAELALGAVSLSLPGAGWVNYAVFVLACGFLGVSGLGYARHRGRACHCFGALSRRRFDALGLAQSTAVAIAAAIGARGVPPAMAGMSAAQHVLLFLAGVLVTAAAGSAAHAMRLVRKTELEMP